jgi:hypothetical protein
MNYEKDKVQLSRYPVNLYRDDEIKTLIQNFTFACLADTVKDALKSESLPDISKFNTSTNTATIANQGIVAFAPGDIFTSYSFKDGKSPTVDMLSILKLEKGTSALRRYVGSPGKVGGRAKVVGGVKLKKASKLIGKSGEIKRIAERISKYTPGGASNGAKRSAQRILTGKTPTLPSPGAGSNNKNSGTTNH